MRVGTVKERKDGESLLTPQSIRPTPPSPSRSAPTRADLSVAPSLKPSVWRPHPTRPSEWHRAAIDQAGSCPAA